jgi:ribulose-phosphate 3-epimerase
MPTPRIEVCPSILSADFRCLEREVKQAQDAGADRIHCDVMDGNFVPNITFGPLVVEAVRKCASIPLDVHLMIADPAAYIGPFCDAGASVLTVHAEVCNDLATVLESIRSRGVRPGVAVNPDKDVSLFLPHLAAIDQVLIMTVFAGFGGQKFIPETLPKMRRVREEADARGLAVDIQVDGGINRETAATCAEHGANVLVAGAYIFGTGQYPQRILAVREAAARGWRESRPI